MPTSPKPRSQPGKNGPEDNKKQSEPSPPLPLLPPPLSEKSATEPTAPVVEDSDNTPLTPEEVRLSRKMNKAVMEILGLKTRSRSFRV